MVTPSMVSQIAPESIDTASTSTDSPFAATQFAQTEPAAKEQRQIMDITVAIPTYNGAKRLPLVLDRLRSQTGIDDISWEVIVCDNNSTDATADVVQAYQQEWIRSCTLRYGFAAEQGAAHARQHAIQLAQGELVAFLDDDNLPAHDWVKNAFEFSQHYPKAGAFGSQIHGKFEGSPPEGFQKIASYLAIVERGSQPHRYEPKTKILPPGAGLAVRRKAWLASVPEKLFLDNKGKGAGLASEDLEAALHIQKGGWEVWYNPDMVVEHLIPNSRLQLDYLKTLLRCIGLSRFYIRMLGITDWKRPLLVPAYIANDLRRLALHWVRHGTPSTDNWVIACEREHLTSSVVSPFFLLKKTYQDFLQNQSIRSIPDQDLWLKRITAGFEQDQFQLYQQPVIAIEHLEHPLAQQEVFVRLGGDTPGNPREFMPVIEHYGLARTLDRWVLRRFLKTHALTSQPSQSQNLPNIHSFNLSRASVCDRQFIDFVAECLTQSNLRADQLCFEVSESIAVEYFPEVTKFANGLNELGCQLIIDNFGVHRNCSDLLKNYPVSFVKFNICLAKSTDEISNGFKTFQEMMRKHSGVDLSMIAKGVETQAVLSHVKTLGIAYAQGFQLSKPRPMDAKHD